MALDDYRFHTQIEVRFRDCDSMGHVNNAVYLTYLEHARFGYWRQVLQGRAATAPKMILARAECDYRAPAHFGEQLEVRLNVGDIGRSSFHLVYEIVNVTSGSRVADGKSVMDTYDYDAGRSVPIPEKTRELLQRFQAPQERPRAPVE